MSRLYGIVFGLISGIAVLWLTMPDVVARMVPGLPKYSLEVGASAQEQHIYFSTSAMGTAWLLWATMMIVGWRMKRWGRKWLGLAVPVGLFGALPLLPFVKLGRTSILRFVQQWSWPDLAIWVLVLLVLTAKAAIWVYWWRLTTMRTRGMKSPAGRTQTA